jgi:cephalosporin hydroxylase
MEFNEIHRTKTCFPIEHNIPLKLDGLLEMPKRFLGGEIDQTYSALYFFEHYIEYHKFKYVVEFGSRAGALSLYLANVAAVTEQFIFHTFEIDKKRDFYNREKGGIGHWFEKLETVTPYIKSFEMDVFSQNVIDILIPMVTQYKTFIFCDNGHKVSEFNTYAPLIKSGDCIACHDWGTEVFESDIQQTIENCNLVLDEPWASSNLELKNLIQPFRKI